MAVEVMIKRKCVEENSMELTTLMAELRSRALSQPGYISSESLKCIYPIGDYNYFIRSKWKSLEDCYAWLQSPERSKIQRKIDTISGGKTEYRIYEPLFDGVFD
jgi:heme-degrading monooxygenase HmoA